MKTSNDYFLTQRDFMEYVANSNNSDDIPMMHFSSKQCEVFSKKITITYEEDCKTEITESQLSKAWEEMINNDSSSVDDFEFLKQKLFGDSNE